MIKYYFSKHKMPFILGGLLCLYYILPREVSLVLELLLLFWVFTRNREAKKISNYPVVWYLLFSGVLFILNILFVDDNSINYVTTCANCLIFVFITSLCVRDEEDISSFITSFGLLGAVFCIFLIPLIIVSLASAGSRIGDAGGADNNAFMSSSISIGYMTTLINICQYYCLNNKSFSKKLRLLFFILFLFSFFCILMSGTRKALISSLLFIIVYTLYFKKTSFINLFFYGFLFCLGLYGLYLLTTQVEFLYLVIGRRLEGLLGFFNPSYADVDESTLAREELIRDGIKIFKDHPLLGAGIKDTQLLLRDASHPHNNYLSCLDFGGIICFILYYVMHLSIIYNFFRMKIRSNQSVFAIGMLIALVITDYFATTYNIIFFPVFLTILYLQTKIDNKKHCSK